MTLLILYPDSESFLCFVKIVRVLWVPRYNVIVPPSCWSPHYCGYTRVRYVKRRSWTSTTYWWHTPRWSPSRAIHRAAAQTCLGRPFAGPCVQPSADQGRPVQPVLPVLHSISTNQITQLIPVLVSVGRRQAAPPSRLSGAKCSEINVVVGHPRGTPVPWL